MNPITTTISEHPFVRTLSREHLDILAQGATERVFKPDEMLFRQGEPANRFYLLIDGKVALEAHNPGSADTPIQTIGPGEVVGWSWLFPPFVWHFQARALERTTSIVLDGALLLVAANKNHDFGFDLMNRVARILISRLQSTRQGLVKR